MIYLDLVEADTMKLTEEFAGNRVLEGFNCLVVYAPCVLGNLSEKYMEMA